MPKASQWKAIRRGLVDALLLATPGAVTISSRIELVLSAAKLKGPDDSPLSPADIFAKAKNDIEHALAAISDLELDARQAEQQLTKVTSELSRTRFDNETALSLLQLNKESAQRITDQSLRVRARGWLEGIFFGVIASLIASFAYAYITAPWSADLRQPPLTDQAVPSTVPVK